MAIYTTKGIAMDSAIILLDGCDDEELVEEISAELESVGEV